MTHLPFRLDGIYVRQLNEAEFKIYNSKKIEKLWHTAFGRSDCALYRVINFSRRIINDKQSEKEIFYANNIIHEGELLGIVDSFKFFESAEFENINISETGFDFSNASKSYSGLDSEGVLNLRIINNKTKEVIYEQYRFIKWL
jgi:hypothetical protein